MRTPHRKPEHCSGNCATCTDKPPITEIARHISQEQKAVLQPDQLARIMGLVPYSKLGVPVAWKIEISQSWNGVTITFCVDPLVVAAAKVKVREFQAELQHVLDTMKPYLPDFKYHARVRKEIKQVLGTIRLRRPNEE